MNTSAVLDPRLTSETLHPLLDSFSEGEGMRKFRDVINETRKVALTNPLGRNESSAYMKRNGEPCCIFGHVLERLGVPFSTNNENNQLYGIVELPWEAWGFEKPNTYQSLWATKVQAAADSGDCYIIAIAMADATLI